MLLNLHLKNLALIDEADISFENGLNILSGETGAGKSVVIGSINMALGSKVSKDFIGKHDSYGFAELVFELHSPELEKKLQELDIAVEDGQVIVSRKIMASRSICRINGVTVNAASMRELAPYFLDVYGQNEHQSLLRAGKHLEILDEFAKEKLGERKAKMAELYHHYQQCRKALSEFHMDEEERLRTLSFLEYEIKEIDGARLVEGEEEELTAAYRKLIHMQQIQEGMAQISAFSSGNGGMMDSIGQALRVIQTLSGFDTQLAALQSQMMDVEAVISDFSYAVEEYISGIEVDEESLQQTQERLDVIHAMKMKYGNSVEAVLSYRQKRQEEYERLLQYDERRTACQKQISEDEDKMRQAAAEISQIRCQEGVQLAQLLRESLLELNFLDVQFEVSVRELDTFSANGCDEVEFMISTNPGEPLRPIREVASGGEMSRIMLAIKTVLADTDEIETLIFDEIDTGISGRTAQKVSEKLALMARSHQVICISHLPQIVSMADHHLLIEKNRKENDTITRIVPLDEAASVKELARLLGGSEITENTQKNAAEMRNMAKYKKEQMRGKENGISPHQ